MLSGGLACSWIWPLGDDEPWRGRAGGSSLGSRPLPCSPCRTSPRFSPSTLFFLPLILPRFLPGACENNHGAAPENPDALQVPASARLDPYAAVVPHVHPVRRRPVQTSLDRIERENHLPPHTLVEPPRFGDRGRRGGEVGGRGARRRLAAHAEAGRGVAGGATTVEEIGRASCRERVFLVV